MYAKNVRFRNFGTKPGTFLQGLFFLSILSILRPATATAADFIFISLSFCFFGLFSQLSFIP